MATNKVITRLERVFTNILMALLVADVAAWALGAWQRHEGWRWLPLECVYVLGFFATLIALLAESLTIVSGTMEDATAAKPISPVARACGYLVACFLWPLVAAFRYASSVVVTLDSNVRHYKGNQLLVLFGVSLTAFWTLYGWSRAGSPPLVRDLLIICYLVGLALFPAIMALDLANSMRWPMMVVGVVMTGFGWPLTITFILIDGIYKSWPERTKRTIDPAPAEQVESPELATMP